MIKGSLESLMLIYIKRFNLILQCAKMQGIWCQGLITPIYKSGDKSDPTNCTGICVSSCLGKLFCSILIKDYTCILKKTRHYITPKLAFYLKIALQTLFSFQGPYHKENVYACFIDFRKAFDSVWHEGLFYRLLKINIGGHFHNLTRSLYCNSTCSIRIGEKKLDLSRTQEVYVKDVF